MKTKIKRHSRSVLSVILAVCMLVTCFTVGLVATDAAKAESSSVGAKVDDTDSSVGAQIDTDSVGAFQIKGNTTRFYFDNSITLWDNVSLVVGKNSYRSVYPMDKCGDSHVWYKSFTGWTDATFVAFTDGTGLSGDSSWSGTSGLTAATHYTSAYSGDYGFDGSGQRYLWTPSTSSNGTAITPEYLCKNADISTVKSGGKQTLTVQESNNGGSTWAQNGNTGNKVTQTSAYVDTNDNNYVKASSNTDVTTTADYNNAAFRADTTLTVTATATGYTFSGFYDTSGNQLSNSTTYSYYPNAATTIYARFLNSSTSYYLHYTENDSDMGSATVLSLTETSSGSGVYTGTVSGWDKGKMNVNVDTNSSNTTNSTSLTSIAVTAGSGVSVNQATPEKNSDYYRCQFSLTKTPQNLSFSFDTSTNILTITGGLSSCTITAGGSSSEYKLKASNGATTINNYGGTASGSFYQDNVLNVTVTPVNTNKKVTAITAAGNTVSAVTDNGDGTYSATLTVAATATITATLADKSNYTVSFSGVNGTVTATVDGNTITTGASVQEGKKVVFTAVPNDGYVFGKWTSAGNSIDNSISNPSTLIVPASNVTVTGNCAVQGYEAVDQGHYSSNTYTMKELSNGSYITTGTVGIGYWFRIRNTASGYESQGTQNGQELNSNKKYNVTNWATYSNWSSGDKAFKNNTGVDAYVVYDPKSDTVYLTTQSDGLFSEYNVYIKDGTVRYLSNSWEGYSADYGTSALLSTGTTSGVTATLIDNNYGSHVRKVTLTAEQIRTGVDLHIQTTVNSTYQSSYYVKGFDVNGGLTQGIIEQEFDSNGDKKTTAASYTDADAGAKIITNHNNDFTLSLTAEKFPDGILEVTPIYFPLSAKESDFVRLYVYDFTEDVKRDWGGMLAIYPYIENKYDPYGKYPGQLMVNIDGVYYSDIPNSYNDGTTDYNIQGLTMNNYVWDALHYDLFYGANQADNNWQTYDYNEFTVINDILKNTPGKEDEDIIFRFKYKDTKTRAGSNLGESTYYVDSDINDATREKDYRNGYFNIDENDSMYQWEDLTDFYGNRVDIFGERVDVTDNDTKAAYNPVRIISNGYDDNEVGYYATAWALYKPVNASGQNAWTGPVDHYELFDVIGGQGRKDRDYGSESFLIELESQKRVRMKYDEAFHNDHWDTEGSTYWKDQGYPQSQLIIDGALVPVQISYEYNVQANKSNINTGPSQQAYRSDGRWYYSNSTELIKVNTIAEVASSKTAAFTRDYFQADKIDYNSGASYNPTYNTGINSGVKAYMTNTDSVEKNSVTYQNVSGNTQAYSISDGKHEFHFKAENDPDGNYLFVGWYRLTENAAGVGYTLASEDLEFTTEAKTNDVYVARFVKIPAGTLNITHSLDSTNSTGTATCTAKAEILDSDSNVIDDTSFPETEGTINIGTKYIKGDSTNKIRITLTTVPGSYCTFTKFEEQITSTLRDLSTSISEITATVSQTTLGTYTATITFDISSLFTDDTQNYTKLPFYSVVARTDYQYELVYSYTSRIWGGQSYKVTGSFTDAELDSYIDTTGEILTFKENKQSVFLTAKAPYEDVYRQTLTWNVSSASLTGSTPLKLKAAISSTPTPDTTVNLTLKFPFAHTYDSENNNQLKPTETDGKILKTEPLVGESDRKTVTYLSRYSLNGTQESISDEIYLQVPEVIYDSSLSKDRYFNYYSLCNEDTNREYARCYSRNLTSAFYQNTIVIPVYEGDTAVSPDEQAAQEGSYAKVEFLENSRNQWNDQKGSASWGYGDRLISDFLLSFKYRTEEEVGGKTVYHDRIIKKETGMKAGLVYETVDDLTVLQDGSKDSDRTHYGTSDTSNQITGWKNAVSTYVKGTGTPSNNSTYLVSEFNASSLDNKNQIEYYYTLANRSSSNKTNFDNGVYTGRKDKYYRVYSYLKDASGNIVAVSDPIYLTVYDVGTIANGSVSVLAS